MNKTFAVIMAGGKGERFWPLSTSKHPKQVLSLIGGKPLLALAVDRLKGLIPPERIMVITSAELVQAVKESVPELPLENIIGEPFGRDTAAACALASAIVRVKQPDGAFCILTADHIIKDIDLFQTTLEESFEIALSENTLLTIGIKPAFPSTGFGYLEAGATISYKGGIEFFKTKRFVEKPDKKTAGQYMESGNFYWNSGMFIWSVKSFQNALAKYQPHLLEMADSILPAVGTSRFDSCLKEEYNKLDKISVDYAVMEKADNIVMAKGTFRWDDVGSWPALEDHFESDSSNNIIIGKCENIDSTGNVVVSNERLTALIGVKDMVVVQAENATLICPKDRAQDVKKMVKLLRETGRYRDIL